MIDAGQVHRTFQLLGRHNQGVPWTAKSPGQTGMAGATALNPDLLIRHLNAQQGWNCFVCLNPSSRSSVKPKKSDISGLWCVGIDYDPPPGSGLPLLSETQPRARRLDAALTLLLGQPNTHVIIDSGRGLWAWVFLEPWLFEHASDRDEADRFVKGFTTALVTSSPTLLSDGIIDSSCAELSRIARAPGTVNHKTGGMAQIVIDYSPIIPISLDHFRNIARPFLPEAPPPREPVGDIPMKLMYIVPRLNTTSRQFVLLGETSGSRHHRLFSAAKDLFELGVPADDAYRILHQGAGRCRPNLNRSDPRAVPNVVKQVWQNS